MGTPPVSDWIDMMADVVTVYPWVSQDTTGKPTYSATPSISACPCRIEMKNHRVIDRTGRETIARGRVIMATTVVPDVRDKVVLPAEYVPVSPPILDVNVVPDDSSSHHVVLELG